MNVYSRFWEKTEPRLEADSIELQRMLDRMLDNLQWEESEYKDATYFYEPISY
jgi:hypothetical protein